MAKAKGEDLRATRASWCVFMRAAEKTLKLPKGTALPEILAEMNRMASELEYLTGWIEGMREKSGYRTLEEFYEAACNAESGRISGRK
jgi:hypothetical protein